MFSCLAVTCHLNFWYRNDRDFLRATAVTRVWNEYRNKSQHRKLTLEKKILPPLLPGLEPATFRSRVRPSNHSAIPAPITNVVHRRFSSAEFCEHMMPECSNVQSSVGFIWESNYTFFYTLCIELFKQYAECKICDLIAIAKLQYRDEILMTSTVRAAASATTKSKRDDYHSQSPRLSICLSVCLSLSLCPLSPSLHEKQKQKQKNDKIMITNFPSLQLWRKENAK